MVALLLQVGSAGCKEHLSSAQHSRFGVGALSSLHICRGQAAEDSRGQAASFCLLLFWLYNTEPIFCPCAAGL